MTTLHKHLLCAAAFAGLALCAGGASAQAGTGSLTGWSTLGDAVSQAGAITLTTAFLDGAGDEAFNLSGTPAVEANDVAAAAGLPVEALDIGGEFAYEGSLVSQSFSVAAGQSLSFSWSFVTQEDLYLDHAFVVIDGLLTTLATTAQPGGAAQTFSYSFTQSGTAKLALGVVDTGDFNAVSSLRFSDVQLSPVPEPGSVVLLLAGLGLLGAAAGRRPGSLKRR